MSEIFEEQNYPNHPIIDNKFIKLDSDINPSLESLNLIRNVKSGYPDVRVYPWGPFENIVSSSDGYYRRFGYNQNLRKISRLDPYYNYYNSLLNKDIRLNYTIDE